MKEKIIIWLIAALFIARAILYYRYAAGYFIEGTRAHSEIFLAGFAFPFILASILIAAGIGLFLFKKWSKTITVILFAVKLPFLLLREVNYTLLFLDTLRPASIKWLGVTTIQIILYAFLIYLLTRPKIKALFK